MAPTPLRRAEAACTKRGVTWSTPVIVWSSLIDLTTIKSLFYQNTGGEIDWSW